MRVSIKQLIVILAIPLLVMAGLSARCRDGVVCFKCIVKTSAPGSITFVNSANNGNTGSATSIATSAPIAVSSGNLLVVFVRNSGSTVTVTSVTDTAGNTFTPATTSVGNDTFSAFFAKNTLASGADTITANFSGAIDFTSILVLQYTGVDTASPLDQVVSSFTTSAQASFTSSPFTTTSANEVIVAGFTEANTGATFTAGGGYTIRVQDPSPYSGAEDKIVSTIQSGATASASSNLSQTWEMIVLTFKASGTATASKTCPYGNTAGQGGGGGGGGNCRTWQPSGPIISINAGQAANFQTIMNGAAAGSIIQPSAGTYNLPGQIEWKSGVNMQCPTGGSVIFRLPVGTAQHFFHMSGVANAAVWNCVFDGSGYTGGGNCGITCAVFFVENSSTNVNIVFNKFQSIANSQQYAYMTGFNSDHIFFEKNTDDGGLTFQPVNFHQTDAIAHSVLSFSYNNFGSLANGPTRMGIEVLLCTYSNVHYDFNTINSNNNIFSISLSDCGGVSNTTNCTAWGNSFGNRAGSGAWGIESAMSDCDEEQNTSANVDFPFVIAGHPVVIANNVANTVNSFFAEDGGYNASEWIGGSVAGTANTLNGSSCIGGQGACRVSQNLGVVTPTSYPPPKPFSHTPQQVPCNPQ